MSARMKDNLQIPAEIETLGDAIRYVREKRGLTLRALARKADITPPFLSDIEHNRRNTEKLEAIARALDMPVETLAKFDGRLTADLKQWIHDNPAVVALLRDIRSSKRPVEELRSAVLSTSSKPRAR